MNIPTLFPNEEPVIHTLTGTTGVVHKTIVGKHFKPIVQIRLPNGNIRVFKIEELESTTPFTLKGDIYTNQPARPAPTLPQQIALTNA